MVTARPLSSRCLRSAHAYPHSAPTGRTFPFLQLSSESRPARPLCPPLSLPVLDFLAPAAISASASQYPTSTIRPRLCPDSRFRSTSRSSFSTSTPTLPAASRPFSHGSVRRQAETRTEAQARPQTLAIHNPRKDDSGEDMAVEITPRAARRLNEIMIKDSNPHLALRITVESGGCHGFQYLMSLTTLNMSTAGSGAVSPGEDGSEDDTVFEATDGSEAKVVMDGPSLELLQGSKIDYTMELIGSQFKIVDNPLATSSCGCGTSFDIKI